MGLNDLHHFTAADTTFIIRIMMGFTIPGAAISLLVLSASAYLAWNPTSRPHLDRVSFRLIIYAMIANMLFGIVFITDVILTGPSAGCNFVAFFTDFTLLFSACIVFCIGLNLQLVLVHSLNGNRMEKWYLVGSMILTCALNIPVYAAREFGWNMVNQTCWFSAPSNAVRLRLVVGTQSFWILLIATGELITFSCVLIYVLRFDRNSRRLLAASSGGSTTRSTDGKSKTALVYATQYRGIILRIGLYPLVSCLLNITTSALDLYQAVDGLNTNIQFYMNIVDLCLYGLRPTCYALIAATDPSFLKAVRSLRKPNGSPLTHTTTVPNASQFGVRTTDVLDLGSKSTQLTVVHFELQPVNQTGTANDFMQGTDSVAEKDDQSMFGYSDQKGSVRASEADVDAERGVPIQTRRSSAISARALALQAAIEDDTELERQFMRYI